MSTRTLTLLAIAALALMLAGVGLYFRRAERLRPDIPELLYPGLIDRVDDLAHVRVVGPEGEFNIRKDDAGVWRLEELGGYPVRMDYLRAAVLSLSDLKVLEGKTSKPENYPRLNVQDPGEGEPSILIQISDDTGEQVVSIVLGGVEPGLMPNQARRYVRLADHPRVLYVDGRAEVAGTLMQWINKQIVMLPRALTHEVTITHPDGQTVRLVRDTPDADLFAVADLPPGAVVRDERDANMIGGAFVYIGLEDVKPAADFDDATLTPGPVATLRTFDGYRLTARLFDHEGQTWARFEASIGEPAPGFDADSSDARPDLARDPAEIAELVRTENDRLARFVFRLPEVSVERLSTRPADLYDSPDPASQQIGPAPAPESG